MKFMFFCVLTVKFCFDVMFYFKILPKPRTLNFSKELASYSLRFYLNSFIEDMQMSDGTVNVHTFVYTFVKRS